MTDACSKHGAPERYTLFTCGCTRIDPLPLRLKAYEAAALTRAMSEAHGDALLAARLLGVSKSTIYRKLVDNPYTRNNWWKRKTS